MSSNKPETCHRLRKALVPLEAMIALNLWIQLGIRLKILISVTGMFTLLQIKHKVLVSLSQAIKLRKCF